jgi:ankyrin repeat protein
VNLTDVNAKGMTGDTLLHSAVIQGAANDVALLIESGADVDALGDLGYTPLHHAASRGFVR